MDAGKGAKHNKRRPQSIIRMATAVLVVAAACALAWACLGTTSRGIHRARFQSKWGIASNVFAQRSPDGTKVTFLRENWIGPFDEITLIDDPRLEWRLESATGGAQAQQYPREYAAYWKGQTKPFFLVTLD